MDENEEQAYFLTVDWCDKGKRGIFTHEDGRCFRKDHEPHTPDEIWRILGPFELILSPKSIVISHSQMEQYTWWQPLEEYLNQYGIVYREDQIGES